MTREFLQLSGWKFGTLNTQVRKFSCENSTRGLPEKRENCSLERTGEPEDSPKSFEPLAITNYFPCDSRRESLMKQEYEKYARLSATLFGPEYDVGSDDANTSNTNLGLVSGFENVTFQQKFHQQHSTSNTITILSYFSQPLKSQTFFVFNERKQMVMSFLNVNQVANPLAGVMEKIKPRFKYLLEVLFIQITPLSIVDYPTLRKVFSLFKKVPHLGQNPPQGTRVNKIEPEIDFIATVFTAKNLNTDYPEQKVQEYQIKISVPMPLPSNNMSKEVEQKQKLFAVLQTENWVTISSHVIYPSKVEQILNFLRKFQEVEKRLCQQIFQKSPIPVQLYSKNSFCQSLFDLCLNYLLINSKQLKRCRSRPNKVRTNILLIFQIQYCEYRKKLQRQIKQQHYHYPLKMSGNCKSCVKCRKKRSAYQCEGCSIAWKHDIRVCISCMEEMHEKLEDYLPQFFQTTAKKSIEDSRIMGQQHIRQDFISSWAMKRERCTKNPPKRVKREDQEHNMKIVDEAEKILTQWQNYSLHQPVFNPLLSPFPEILEQENGSQKIADKQMSDKVQWNRYMNRFLWLPNPTCPSGELKIQE